MRAVPPASPQPEGTRSVRGPRRPHLSPSPCRADPHTSRPSAPRCCWRDEFVRAASWPENPTAVRVFGWPGHGKIRHASHPRREAFARSDGTRDDPRPRTISTSRRDCGAFRTWPTTCGGPGTPAPTGPSAGSTPKPGRVAGHNPVTFLRRVPRLACRPPPGARRYLTQYDAIVRAFDDYLAQGRPGLVPDDVPRTGREPDRLLLDRIRRARSRSRSTPAAWASSPATISRRPATSGFRWWRSGSSTRKDTFASTSRKMAGRKPNTPRSISTTCRFCRCSINRRSH